MPICEERLCEGRKENTKLELKIFPDRIRGHIVATVFLHVTHSPFFWNDQGRKITFFLNGTIIAEEITDKDGRCQIIIYNLHDKEDKATLLVDAEGTTWTTPCKISVDIWEEIDEKGNAIIYSERVLTPEEKEKMPAWEKVLVGSAVIISLGVAGYFLIKAKS